MKNKSQSLPPRRILVIQTAFIGDVILATALLESIHACFPEAQLDFLVRKGNEGLLRHHPFLSNVLIWDKGRHKYRNLFRILLQVRASGYDWVINLQRYMATGIMVAGSGARERIGFKGNPLAFCYSRRVDHGIGDGRHEFERNLDLLRSVRSDVFPRRPALYPSPSDHQKAAGFKGPTYVCMAPSSVWFTKQLPQERWIELIGFVPNSIRVYLIGSGSDFAFCEEIRLRAGRNNTENLCGQLNLLESASLMKDAAMNFVNDSAPLHLCSAMNAPVTAFFCSTVPDFGFGPLSDQAVILQHPGPLNCRPCGLHGFTACPKGHFECGFGLPIPQLSTFPGLSS